MTLLVRPVADNAADNAVTRTSPGLLPRPVTAAGRAIGTVSQWGLEVVASRPLVSAVTLTGSWPFLTTTGKWEEVCVAGVMLTAATLTERRQSLLRLRTIVQYRYRVVKVIRRWPKVISRNAAMGKVTPASDLIGHPTKLPGKKDIPVIIRGWRSVRWAAGRPRYFGPRRTPFGLRVTIDGSSTGAIKEQFANESGVIRSSFDAHSARVSMNRWRDHWTDIDFLFSNPFKNVISPESLPPATEDLGVVLGVDVNGEPVEHSLWLPTLIVGGKGSGKSRAIRRALQSLCESGQPFLAFVFDPKGRGQEFGWLRNAAYRYEPDRGKWAEFITEVANASLAQASRLSELGLPECPANDERFPLLLVIVDELGTALGATSKTRKVKVGGASVTVEEALNGFMRENRSAGATMLACAQQIQKEVLGQVRGLFDFVICLRVNDRETAQIATGDAKQFPAHEIPPHRSHAGTGFVSSSEFGVVKFRVALTPDSAMAGIVRCVSQWTSHYKSNGW